MKGYKKWLSVLTVVVMASALMVWRAGVRSGEGLLPTIEASDETTVDEADRADSGDGSPAGVIKRLGKVGRIMTKMSGRLDTINGSFEPPPDDMKPPMLAALADIKTQANTVITTAEEIETKLRATPPPP
jgi:hypothetical protein